MANDVRMRFSINIPNFGDFADPRNVATVAAAAEESGWDGLFVWDHVHYRGYSGRPFGDAWMLLTAAALATSRIPCSGTPCTASRRTARTCAS